jgi:dTDP-4-dehydrorhamnose reductase
VRVLITGADGFVARYLARLLASEHEVIAVKHGGLDITNATEIKRVTQEAQPALIANCAVVGVDQCEQTPALAQAINVDGPRLLAEASARLGAEFLHFSSNYVFDGNRMDGLPYTTNDEPLPVNIYGQTKLEGERATCAVSARTYIIRTSWVFGPGKTNFLSTAHERLRDGLRLRAITDTWACATYVVDLVERTRQILARGRYGIYQIVNEGACSYQDFTIEAAGLVGLSTADADALIESVTEAEMDRVAPRPRWTPLRCLFSEELNLTPMRDWRSALKCYLREGPEGAIDLWGSRKT